MGPVSLFLALLLALSAAHKLAARERLAAIVARLAGVTLPLGTVLLALAATLEALAAFALLVPALHQGGAIAAAALWSAYALALLRQRGKVLDCGCDFIARERPVDAFAVLRPLVLVLLAGLSLGAGPIGWSLEAPLAALALLALWFAAGELHSIPQTRSAR